MQYPDLSTGLFVFLVLLNYAFTIAHKHANTK